MSNRIICLASLTFVAALIATIPILTEPRSALADHKPGHGGGPPQEDPVPQFTFVFDPAIDCDPQSPDYFCPQSPMYAFDPAVCTGDVNEQNLVLPDEVETGFHYGTVIPPDCWSVWPTVDPEGNIPAEHPLDWRGGFHANIDANGVLRVLLIMRYLDGNRELKFGSPYVPVQAIDITEDGFILRVRADAVPMRRAKKNDPYFLGYVSIGDIIYTQVPE